MPESSMESSILLGVDTGGTFTDFVLLKSGQLSIHKVLSTPQSPEQAILQGIKELALEKDITAGHVVIVHGSTVATNAALENKGVKTAFITNTGFKDLLSIGRQARSELYQLQPIPHPPPVPTNLCFETAGRIDHQGREIEPTSPEHLDHIRKQLETQRVEAIAINALFSFLNAGVEKNIAQALDGDWFISVSHNVLPESGEYERGIATWLNASLSPKVMHYLKRLQAGVQPCPLSVMQSTGGTMSAEQAGQSAVNMLLSGPAGGLAAAHFLSTLTGRDKWLTFDMGGTSTDVALIDGQIQLTNEGHIGPWPVAVPQVDMHTIGAGGGSIAYVDEGGLLRVGPESAGAEPGPACYGRQGRHATVTDANAVLGRLHPDFFLGGKMSLDLTSARQAIEPLAKALNLSIEATAQGILRIANEHMVKALRVISIERGYDTQDFRLCCFGGAGGLHVCALADTLEMTKAIVPIYGGVLSALGMIVAPKSRQLSHASQGQLLDFPIDILKQHLTTLEQAGVHALQQDGVDPSELSVQFSLDVRYLGQRYYLNIPWQENHALLQDAFHQQHETQFGHRLTVPIELVNLRCQVLAINSIHSLPSLQSCAPESVSVTQEAALEARQLHGFETPVAVYNRAQLSAGQRIPGPALIVETVSTTLVNSGWQAQLDAWGNLILDRET